MSRVHIFWDNSNIHIVGLRNVMGLIEPSEDPALYRTYFKGVFELARRNREVGKAYLAGSKPPENDDLWNYIRTLGIDVDPLERTGENRENAIDISIQAAMLRTAIDNIGSGDTIIVLTGDGAGGLLGVGFLADLQRIHERMGFNFEVISWENGCNGRLMDYAKQNGLFIPLEKYYYEVTFIKEKRRAKPFAQNILANIDT
jgi:hypothetical protein